MGLGPDANAQSEILTVCFFLAQRNEVGSGCLMESHLRRCHCRAGPCGGAAVCVVGGGQPRGGAALRCQVTVITWWQGALGLHAESAYTCCRVEHHGRGEHTFLRRATQRELLPHPGPGSLAHRQLLLCKSLQLLKSRSLCDSVVADNMYVKMKCQLIESASRLFWAEHACEPGRRYGVI